MVVFAHHLLCVLWWRAAPRDTGDQSGESPASISGTKEIRGVGSVSDSDRHFPNSEETKSMGSVPGIYPVCDLSSCSNSLCMLGWHLPSQGLSFFDCQRGIWIRAVLLKWGIWITGGTEVSFGDKWMDMFSF